MKNINTQEPQKSTFSEIYDLLEWQSPQAEMSSVT